MCCLPCVMQDDWTVLQLSCAVGDRAAIAFAMEHGADVNDCSAVSCELMLCITLIFHIHFLVQSRVLPRCTPLHILARYDMFDLIDCLPGRTDFNKQDQVRRIAVIVILPPFSTKSSFRCSTTMIPVGLYCSALCSRSVQCAECPCSFREGRQRANS